MRFRWFRLGLLAAAACAQPGEPGNLELRLVPENLQGEVPGGFTFLLVNKTSHEVRIPIPAIECEDAFDGAISLRLDFRPLEPGPAAEGHGCVGDRMNWPPILERIKEWKVLVPGESLTLKADREHLFYGNQQPGTYEFWATYRPPSISPLDQGTLKAVGIDFPGRELTSAHFVFVRR